MSVPPHDYDREFAAWERFCAALYAAEQASLHLAQVAEHDCDRESAVKIGMRLIRIFEDRWRIYGFRKQQAQEKR